MLKLLGTLAVLLSSLSSARAQFADWNEVTNGIRTDLLIDMAFISPDIGFAVGDSNKAWKTIDGAQQWTSFKLVECADCAYRFYKIKFFEKRRGYIWGVQLNTSKKIVLATTDYGETWHVTDSMIADVEYTSEDFGYKATRAFAGDNAWDHYLFATTDMGKSWSTRYLLNFELGDGGFTSVYAKFGDSLNGIVSESIHYEDIGRPDEDNWHFTVDGGKTWTPTFRVSESSAPELFHPLGNERWLACYNRRIWLSEDGGRSWNSILTLHKDALRFFTGGRAHDLYVFLGRGDTIGHVDLADPGLEQRSISRYVAWVERIEPFVSGTSEGSNREESYMLAMDTGFVHSRIYKYYKAAEFVQQAMPSPIFIRLDGHELRILAGNASAVPAIYNVLGRQLQVKASLVENGNWVLDLSAVHRGPYFLLIGGHTSKFLLDE
jgi:photosystem II stability/assembly factor-like uncharacterized protein